jgi:hypothetical protein
LAALIASKSDSLTFLVFTYHLTPTNTTIMKKIPRTIGIAIQLLELPESKD